MPSAFADGNLAPLPLLFAKSSSIPFCESLVIFHELVCLLYKVHLAHVAFLQKRIDFVKQIARYHSLKIAARRLTLFFILRLVFAVCHSLRSIFLSRYHFIPPKIFLVYILYYILQDFESQGSARNLCLAGHGD